MQFLNNMVYSNKGVSVDTNATAVVRGNCFAANTERSISAYPAPLATYEYNVILSNIELNNNATPNLSGNYWTGGNAPDLPDGVICTSYYTTKTDTIPAPSVGASFTLDNLEYVGGETKVAQIGTTQYETLAAAIDAAKNGDTITLLADVTLTDSIDINKALTIDLNGHSISYDSNSVSGEKFTANTAHDYLIGVKRGGDLTIVDASSNGGGMIDGSALCVAVKLTTKGENDATNAANVTVGAVNAANNFTIKGYEYGISGNGTRHNANLTVYGGTIEAVANDDNASVDSSGIYFPQEGTLNIHGGTMRGYKSGVELRSGTLNVDGGEFVALATTYDSNPNGNGTTAVGAALAIAQHTTNKRIVANITGGTYSGVKTISIANPQNNAFDNVRVSGSASLLTDSIEIPEGYEWVTANGVSTLKKSFVSEAYDGNVAQANFVDTTFINVQDSLYLNVVLYVGGTEKNNGSVKFSFLGIDETVALSDFDKPTSATLDQQSAIALATNGYYCYKSENYYVVRLKVLAYQISAEAAVQLLDGDGKAVKLYQNTGASCFLNETAPLANKLLTINANNQYTGSVKTFLTNYSGSEAAVVAALLTYGTEAEKVWKYDGTKKA